MDAELVDDRLEVRPTVKRDFGVSDLVTAHPAHSADVGLCALLLVIGDCNRCHVCLKQSHQSNVALDVLFHFDLDLRLGNGLTFLFSVVLEYCTECKLACVQFVDRILRVSDFFHGPCPQLFQVVNLLLASNQSVSAPDFALDPVLDVFGWIGLAFAHKFHFLFKIVSLRSRK